jgi:hypothetical protein
MLVERVRLIMSVDPISFGDPFSRELRGCQKTIAGRIGRQNGMRVYALLARLELLPTSTFRSISHQKINRSNGVSAQRLPIFAFGRRPG